MENIWMLEKYARVTGTENDNISTSTNWKYFSNTTNHALSLVLAPGLLIVKDNTTILESHNLIEQRENTRGVAKGDSLLVMIKTNGLMRQFRVKFKQQNLQSAIEVCVECVKLITQYFPVKLATAEVENDTMVITEQGCKIIEKESAAPQVLSGEVTLGDISEAILNQNCRTFPSIYSKLSMSHAPDDLKLYIRMCLCDATFPSFVEAVEKCLNELMEKGC